MNFVALETLIYRLGWKLVAIAVKISGDPRTSESSSETELINLADVFCSKTDIVKALT